MPIDAPSEPGAPGRPARGATELVVYGRRAVLEALAAEHVEVLGVRAARQVPTPIRKQLAAACRERGLDLETTSAAAVRAWSDEPRHDQGVAARVRLLAVLEVEALVAQCTGRGARAPTRLMALDGVTNPQNVGMIARSVVGAGLAGLVWPLAGSPWVNGLVVKSSASAVYRCPIVRCETLAAGLHTLQGAGFEVIGLAQRGETPLFDFAPPHRSVFVVGAETTGISREIAALVDRWVSIPLAEGIESLNVAVAASLVCFQVASPGTGRRL